MGISMNGPSGIDTASLIEQLVALEQVKVTKISNQKDAYQVKIDAYSRFKQMVTDLQTSASKLNTEQSFDLFKSSTTNTDIVTAEGGVGAVEGRYNIGVFQLAQNEKMISADNKILDQTKVLSTYGLTNGIISVDGVSITIDAAKDTLQDLRMKINNATTTSGAKLGVTASVLKLSDTNYRLVLSSKETGAKGIDYKDVSGSVLKDLGIITSSGTNAQTQSLTSTNNVADIFAALAVDSVIQFGGTDHSGTAVTGSFTASAGSTIDDFIASIKTAFNDTVNVSVDGVTGKLIVSDTTTGASQLSLSNLVFDATPETMITDTVGQDGTNGSKGTQNQAFTSSDNIAADFAALAQGTIIQFGGTDHNGNSVSNSFVVGAGSTVNDLLASIKDTFHGMVNASIDGTGKLVISDIVGGNSQLNITSLSFGAAAKTMTLSTAGKNGAGVLSVGRDAFFNIDSINLSSTKNVAENFISGVKLTLKKADTSVSSDVTIDRDASAIEKKVNDMLNAYNALVRFVKENTKYADPKDKNSKAGDLAGDSTVSTIVGQYRSLFQKQFDLYGGTYTSGTMIGIKTDTNSGEYSLDITKFEKALTNGYSDVQHLFVTSGTSSSGTIVLGTYTSETTSGKYNLDEPDNAGMRIQNQSGGAWVPSDVRTSDIINFSQAPVKGLAITAPINSIGAGNTATFTFQKGLTTLISEMTDKLIDGHEGMIVLRQNSLRSSIDQAADRMEQMSDRVTKYKDRLTKQFSAMEQTISKLQSQSASLSNALQNISYS